MTDGGVLEICCSNDGRVLLKVEFEEALLLVVLKTMPFIGVVFVPLLVFEEVFTPTIVNGDEVLGKLSPMVVLVKLLAESFRLVIGRETLLRG